MGALVLAFRNRAESSLGHATRDFAAERRSPPTLANPLLARRFLFPLLPDVLQSEFSILWLRRQQPRRVSGRARRYPLNPRDRINLRHGGPCCFGDDQSDATWHRDPRRPLASIPTPEHDSPQPAADRVKRRNESLREEMFWRPLQA